MGEKERNGWIEMGRWKGKAIMSKMERWFKFRRHANANIID